MKNCRPSGNSVGRQKFFIFCGDVTQAPHALCPNPPIPPYGAGAEIWAVGFLFCGKQPLNILEVVGLRAPTAVETCHWHVSKSRLSNPTFGVKNKDHPDGWSLFWRRRWDSNPRGVLPPTRFRVELVMTTSILLRIAPVLQALIYSIMQ